MDELEISKSKLQDLKLDELILRMAVQSKIL